MFQGLSSDVGLFRGYSSWFSGGWATVLAFLLMVPRGMQAEEAMFQGRPAAEVILERWDAVGAGWNFNSGTNAALILEQMGPDIAVPALVSILQGSDWRESETYRDTWRKLPQFARSAMPPPIYYSRAERALSFLGRFGPWASNAIPALLEEFRKGDDQRKQVVSATMAEMGIAAARAVPVLAKELPKADPRVQVGILRVFQTLGSAAHLARLPTADLAAKATNEVRAEAALALWMMARDTNAVLSALRPLIVAADSAAGNAVMRTLQEMGPAARPLTSELLASLPRWNPVDRPEMIWAVGRVAGADPAVLALLKSMIAPDSKETPEVLRGSVLALGGIGPEAADVLPDLIDLWKRQPELGSELRRSQQEQAIRNLVSAIIQTLGKIGPAAHSALPDLREAWRPGGERPKGGGKGLALHAALAIWQIDQGKTHSASDLIRDWSEWTRPSHEQMASRRAVSRWQLQMLWLHQSEELELLRQGDPDHYRRLVELREDFASKW